MVSWFEFDYECRLSIVKAEKSDKSAIEKSLHNGLFDMTCMVVLTISRFIHIKSFFFFQSSTESDNAFEHMDGIAVAQ